MKTPSFGYAWNRRVKNAKLEKNIIRIEFDGQTKIYLRQIFFVPLFANICKGLGKTSWPKSIDRVFSVSTKPISNQGKNKTKRFRADFFVF